MSQSEIQKLLAPSALRLGMGELTQAELEVAQAAAHQALERLESVHGWTVVPKSPSSALLMSMAVRLDHGLGVPGHYDSLNELREQLPGLEVGDGQLLTHQQRVEEALEVARKAHAALVSPVHHSAKGIIVDDVVASVGAQHPHPHVRLATAAARYALTNLERYGLTLLPPALTPDHLQSVVQVFANQASGPRVDGLERVWEADAHRLHEEVSGRGFFRPGPRRPGPSV